MSNLKRENDEKFAFLTIFSVLLGFAAVATTAAFLLIRFFIDKAYQKRWSDYDDCGVI